jgi:hypothetical protein
MAKLGDLAQLIRSKNAGAFTLTFDVMFDTQEVYEKVKRANILTKERFAAMYGVPEHDVKFFVHDAARAIKISIPRPYVQSSREDGDAYGGQQHAPLVDIEVPD